MTSPTAHIGDLRRELEVLETVHRRDDEGQEILEVTFRVPGDLLYFSGHFPGDPLLPGVVQIAVVALPQVERCWPELGGLRGIRRLKFIQPIRPCDVVRLRLVRRSTPGRVELTIFDEKASPATSGVLLFAEGGSK